MNAEDKVAIITGASRGVGKAMTLRLASRRVKLVLAARTVRRGDSVWPGSLEETAQQARAAGAEVTVVKCDVSERADLEHLYGLVLNKYNRADILINNAMYSSETPDNNAGYEPSLELSINEWQRHITGNILANVVACKLCLPSMIENRNGIILCLTSRAATHNTGLPGKGGTNAAYATTKAAINRFVSFVAEEIRDYKIPIIAFGPGPAATERYQNVARHGVSLGKIAGIGNIGWHSTDVPAAAMEYLCFTCPDPMVYTGQVLHAIDLYNELQLR
jgi:NAD(P)-dependent dehydrogenase (short-subunit alcohol dehydrogenase family)